MQSRKRNQQGSAQVIALVVVAVVLAGAYVALDFYSEGQKNIAIAESRGANLVNGLTKHKLDAGGYPDALDKLVPKYLSALPKCPNGDAFAFQVSGSEFSLTCQKVVFKSNPYTYTSRTRAWAG
jgi:hypothetical protein